MSTEFDDGRDYALFIRDSKTMRANNSYGVRWSSIVMAALRSVGLFDNMEDGFEAPSDTAKFWLDKNTDPAVLKKYDSVAEEWAAVTFDTVFNQPVEIDLSEQEAAFAAILAAAVEAKEAAESAAEEAEGIVGLTTTAASRSLLAESSAADMVDNLGAGLALRYYGLLLSANNLFLTDEQSSSCFWDDIRPGGIDFSINNSGHLVATI